MEYVKIGNFLVGTNGSGELFVKLEPRPGWEIPELRISDISNNRITVTAQGSVIQPTSINGCDAFRITKF